MLVLAGVRARRRASVVCGRMRQGRGVNVSWVGETAMPDGNTGCENNEILSGSQAPIGSENDQRRVD